MAVHQERGLDELLNKLPPEDAKEVVKDLVFDSIRETLGHSDAVMAEVTISRARPAIPGRTAPEGADAVRGGTRGDAKGQRLVLVGPDYGSSRKSSASIASSRKPRRAEYAK